MEGFASLHSFFILKSYIFYIVPRKGSDLIWVHNRRKLNSSVTSAINRIPSRKTHNGDV